MARRLAAREWKLWKDLRLRALEDSPLAFGQTLEKAAAWPDSRWRERAGGENPLFIAELDGQAVGIAAGWIDEEKPDQAHLLSMWVEPEARGRGAGRELVEAVSDWALEKGADTLMLWVTKGNSPAVSLYEAAGFEVAGPEQPLEHRPDLTLALMFKRLR